MKKYIKPTIEWQEIEGVLPLASSKPGISGETAGSGVEACSLGEEGRAVAFDMDDGSDDVESY